MEKGEERPGCSSPFFILISAHSTLFSWFAREPVSSEVNCELWLHKTKQTIFGTEMNRGCSFPASRDLPSSDCTVLKRILLLWEGQVPADRQALLWRPHPAGSEQPMNLKGIFLRSPSKVCVCLTKAGWRGVSFLPQDYLLESSKINGSLAPLEKLETSDSTELLSRALRYVLCWWMHQTRPQEFHRQTHLPSEREYLLSSTKTNKIFLRSEGEMLDLPSGLNSPMPLVTTRRKAKLVSALEPGSFRCRLGNQCFC